MRGPGPARRHRALALARPARRGRGAARDQAGRAAADRGRPFLERPGAIGCAGGDGPRQEGAAGPRVAATPGPRHWAGGCIFNPGALTHYAWSLRDAVAAVKYPVVEVRLSEPKARESFRHLSVLEGVAAHRIAGRGHAGYLEAL